MCILLLTILLTPALWCGAATPTVTPTASPTPFYVVGSQNLVEAFPQPGFDREGFAAQYAHSLDGQLTYARILWATEAGLASLAKQTTRTTEAKYNQAFGEWNGWHGTKDYLDTVEQWAIELKDGAAEKKSKKLKEKLLKGEK